MHIIYIICLSLALLHVAYSAQKGMQRVSSLARIDFIVLLNLSNIFKI